MDDNPHNPPSQTSNVINQEALADWQEYTAADGRRYYYNKRTKQSSWKKPLELMTPVERADASTVWKEFTAADGKKYYYNMDTKQSKWTIPKELKLAREHFEKEASRGTQSPAALTSSAFDPPSSSINAANDVSLSHVAVTPVIPVRNAPPNVGSESSFIAIPVTPAIGGSSVISVNVQSSPVSVTENSSSQGAPKDLVGVSAAQDTEGTRKLHLVHARTFRIACSSVRMSSRRARGGQTLRNPMIRPHRYLNFHDSYSETIINQFRERLIANVGQSIEVFDAINWNVLEHVIARDEFTNGAEAIKNLLATPYVLADGNIGFVSYAWSRLFSIREDIYRELVVEFYSTFRFDHRSTSWTEDSIYFQLGGQPRRMSLIQFALGIGLYEPNELNNPHFLDHISAGAVKKLTDLEVAQEWQFIAQGSYGSSTPSYRAIRDPRHRLIHRLLTYTIVGRKAPEKVSRPDLFYLSSIIMKRLVNVPWRLAKWMSKRATGTRDGSSLCGGHFVTRLARHFGLATQDEMGSCTIVQPGMGWLTARRLEAFVLIEPCSIYGGAADMYYWVPTTAVGQTLQSRQGRGRGDTSGSNAGRGTAGSRNRGYAAEFDRLSQQIDQMFQHHTQRFDQIEFMQRQHFHQTSAHLDYQDGLFQQLFGQYPAELTYQPFQYYMPQEFMRPPPPQSDQADPSYTYQQPEPSHQYRSQEDDSD